MLQTNERRLKYAVTVSGQSTVPWLCKERRAISGLNDQSNWYNWTTLLRDFQTRFHARPRPRPRLAGTSRPRPRPRSCSGTSGDLPGSRWVHSAASSVHWENEGTIKTKKKLLKKVKDCERSLIGSGPIKTKKRLLKKIKDCERSLILPFPVILRSIRGTL